jgi:hypothetical protein
MNRPHLIRRVSRWWQQSSLTRKVLSGVGAACVAILVTVVGTWISNRIDGSGGSPTEQKVGVEVVVDPSVAYLEVDAIPTSSSYVESLRGGTRLRVDCITVVGRYGFAHISGIQDIGYWVDATQLLLPSGQRLLQSGKAQGACPS